MRCIFCLEERPPSQEHVFPRAIGGSLTIHRVCDQCNSELGTRVDAALGDFLPVRARRAKLGLAGNSGVVPKWYEIFLGDATLVGEAAGRIQTTFDEATGKLTHRQLHRAENVERPDGQKVRQITLHPRDKDQIPEVIRRERLRHKLRPLSDEELEAESKNFTERTVQTPIIKKDPGQLCLRSTCAA
ncbi:HNH endonuclease [Bradyrhizobium sp. USDA 4454]